MKLDTNTCVLKSCSNYKQILFLFFSPAWILIVNVYKSYKMLLRMFGIMRWKMLLKIIRPHSPCGCNIRILIIDNTLPMILNTPKIIPTFRSSMQQQQRDTVKNFMITLVRFFLSLLFTIGLGIDWNHWNT